MKNKKKDTAKRRIKQGQNNEGGEIAKINAKTKYEISNDRITAFGGLLALVKFLDMIEFKEVFDQYYRSPERKTQLGCYRMIKGILIMLFVGFARIAHLGYLRDDPMICGILGVTTLPVVSTFWRYLNHLGQWQSRSLLDIGGVLRTRVWQAAGLNYESISLNIDTTVATVYGDIEGARKGHNTKHRGKKGLRPVLVFIEETREYLYGMMRRGTTMSDEDVAKLILELKPYLPTTIKNVLVRGDAEFIGPLTVAACETCGFHYIFGNKSAKPVYKKKSWYQHAQYQYNDAYYQPQGWELARRFVAMRIREEDRGDRQLKLFEEDEYFYREFVTNLPQRPHVVVRRYDQRASVENCIKEAQQEGILAIPSKRFWSNHAYFQIVMLAYNIWRWMKIMSQAQARQNRTEEKPIEQTSKPNIPEPVDHTIRITRLKLLFLPAKLVKDSRTTKVRYSIHDARAEGLLDYLSYIDKRREERIKWADNIRLNRKAMAA